MANTTESLQAGIGTIIEGNQFANLFAGIHDPGVSTMAALDLVIWNNYFRNVCKGIQFSERTGGLITRLIATDNLIEVGTNLSAGLSAPTGIILKGSNGQPPANRYFGQVILKKNFIRDVLNPTTPTLDAGIKLQHCTNALVESNVINNTNSTAAVVCSDCTTTKFFNNQNSSGQLLNGYVGGTKALELEDAVQDVLLPL